MCKMVATSKHGPYRRPEGSVAGFNRFAHSAGPSRGEVAEEEGNNKNNNKNSNEYNSNDNIRNENHKVPKLGKAVLMVAARATWHVGRGAP